MSRWYRTVTGAINRPAGTSVGAAIALTLAVASPLARAQDASSVVGLIVAHARAHPVAVGPITSSRHELAHARTTVAHGELRLAPEGLRVTLGPTVEIAVSGSGVESFDDSSAPPLVLSQRGETVLARYAAVVAGEDPSTLFDERVLARDGETVSVELLPRAPLPGVERLVLRVDDAGGDRGRVLRALWLDGLGNWQRFDLEALRYPARLDAATLSLSPHPGARRVEL